MFCLSVHFSDANTFFSRLTLLRLLLPNKSKHHHIQRDVRAKKGGKIMNIENKITRMQTRLIRNLKVVCIFFFAVVCLFEHVLR